MRYIVPGLALILAARWFLGGIHLAELRDIGANKSREICGADSLVIEQGYQRTIFQGFGGRRWYQCKIGNVWYQFAITRRLNSSEAQVYDFQQKTTFPNQFEVNK